jgi:hypothetical protein
LSQIDAASSPTLLNMPKEYESRTPKINQLLKLMETTPMDRQEMADYVGLSYKSLCKYVSKLHKERKIYICGHDRKRVIYKTGDQDDVIRQPRDAAAYVRQYRERKRRIQSNEPRMDQAASWMFNPK